MKILSIGNFGTSWDGSICDEEHIARALEQLGHQVTRHQREDKFIKGEPDNFDFTLIAQWSEYMPDFSMLSRPLVYWAFDYQADGQEWHERLVMQSDLYLSKRIADSTYPNWQWFSQDFAPEFLHATQESTVKDIDVLFTGSYLPWAAERNETLKAVDDNFNLVIHSVTPDEFRIRGFKHVYGPVMDKGLIDLVARAKINLSIDHTIEAGYWSDRNAQVICCGGFVLTRYVPLMESRFHHNVIYFHNQQHCLDQIAWWLDHDEDREVIAAEGYENAAYYKAKEKAADLLEAVQRVK